MDHLARTEGCALVSHPYRLRALLLEDRRLTGALRLQFHLAEGKQQILPLPRGVCHLDEAHQLIQLHVLLRRLRRAVVSFRLRERPHQVLVARRILAGSCPLLGRGRQIILW